MDPEKAVQVRLSYSGNAHMTATADYSTLYSVAEYMSSANTPYILRTA